MATLPASAPRPGTDGRRPSIPDRERGRTAAVGHAPLRRKRSQGRAKGGTLNTQGKDREAPAPATTAAGREQPVGSRSSALVFLAALRNWAALLALGLILTVATEGRFLSPTNLSNILHQTAINTILSVGMTFVILTGGIDLSVGSVLALSGVCLALALHRTESVAVGVATGMGVGAACGLVNGLATSVGRVPPFVSTLGMMSAARGLTLFITDGQSVRGFPDAFQMIGLGVVPVGPLALPAPALTALAVVVLGAALLRFTAAGRYFLALGGSEQATRLSGVPVVWYKTLVYTLSGLCAGLGGAVLTAKFNSAQVNAGTGYELDAIAAVVLGGASLSGGRGSLFGTLSGALLIGVLRNGLNLMRARLGLSPHLQEMVIGAIIVLTVVVDQRRRRSYE